MIRLDRRGEPIDGGRSLQRQMSPAGQTWGILWFLQRVKDNSEHEAVCGFLNSRAPHHLLPSRAFAELFLKAETLKDWKHCREKSTDKTASISLS